MNQPNSHVVKAGAKLLFCAGTLLWSVCACAEDQQPPGAAPASVQERQVVILPAMKANGMRSGYALLITDRGAEYVKPDRLAQHVAPKPFPIDGFCMPR